MPYHVRITQRSDRTHDEVRLDLWLPDLEKRFLIPYREGHPIVIGGKTIPTDDIERIRITYTDEMSEQLLPVVRAERAASRVATWVSDAWYVANHGRDVTDDLITGPPGSGISERPSTQGPSVEVARVVFVVHGRNAQARDAMFAFLRAIGLDPLEFGEAVLATGKTAPYVGEVLDKAFSMAQAIVVLMTPDDEARLLEAFRQPGDPLHETVLTPQARPNVLFEAGMAMGRNPDRTILVELGSLRPFSDAGGRHVIRLDNSSQRRQDLAKRLEAAGCPINLRGTDWHSTGDFTIDSVVEPGTGRAQTEPRLDKRV